MGLAIFHGSTGQYDSSPISKIIVELDNDSKKLKGGIDTLYPGGGTAMGDGIHITTQSLSQDTRSDARKIIVLLSDGVSNIGLDPRLAAGIARENNVTIYSVGYGDFADVQTLKAIASVTGGEYYDAPTGKDLAKTFNEIADVLISPVSHYSSRILILLSIPVLLFIPTIERGFTTMMEKVQDKPVKRNVKKSTSKLDTIGKNICNKCNHPNRPSSKFCIKCGSTIGKNICNKCNHPNRPSSKFCIKCGDVVGGYGR
jgi:ribosomal protein L40E